MADQPEDRALPVPPPFMWACPTCAALLEDVGDAVHRAAEDSFYDGGVRIQIALARHLADIHPDALPDPHDECETCARFERHPLDRVFWREHLARGLFLPDEVARLL